MGKVSGNGNGADILIIDNEASVRSELAGFLREKGHRVTETADCDEGWMVISEHEPDLVIVEAGMKCLKGLEFLTRIKAFDDELPVIFITEAATVKMTAAALKGGASDFITKPLHLRDLYVTLSRLLQMQKVREGHKKVLPYSDFSMNLEFPSDVTYIQGAVYYLTENLRDTGMCRPGEVSNVNLALYEAIANAIGHGNRNDLGKMVEIEAHINHDRAKFIIRDEGAGFTMKDVPDPTEGANLNNLRGRGLYLMQNFMDEVAFNDKGNEVTMVKKRSQPLG